VTRNLRARSQLLLLENVPIVLFVILFATFGLVRPDFVSLRTVELLADQVAITGILAVGMTFVLLTAGIDLSVGATMYLCAVAMARLLGAGDVVAAFVICLAIGTIVGLVNGVLVTRLRIVPFVVTLAILFVARGSGQSITQSRLVTFPEQVTSLSTQTFFGIPVVPLIFGAVLLIGHAVLTRTTFGRQIYAVGHNPEAAVRAGIRRDRVLIGAYIVCALCAAIAGLVAAAQQSVAQNNFGEGKEFDAISAAVLGGASLFGGRGRILPGTLIGAVLIALVAHGLTYVGLDIYLQPLVTAAIIFLAVLLDSIRNDRLLQLRRRYIRPASA
jgi:ribose transport system permease protein